MATKVDLALDPITFDIYLDEGGDLALDADLEVLRADIKVTLKSDRGQWAFDVQFGTPWRQQLLKKAPDIPRISATLKAVVYAVDGVNRILQWTPTFDRVNRKLTIDAKFDTVYGVVPETFTIG